MVLHYYLTNNLPDRPVYFRRPIRIGSYAVNKDDYKRKLIDNAEDYYVKYSLEEFERTGHLDLKDGFETRPDDELYGGDFKLNELLEWIIKNKKAFLLKNETLINGKLRNLNTDFVSFRGTLTLLLNCIYDSKTQFTIHVELFKNTYYIQLEKNEDLKNENENLLLYCYAGRRFELYCSKEFSDEDKVKMNASYKPKTSEDNEINKDKYKNFTLNDLCFTYRSRLNKHSLVYGAEIDCFENITPLYESIDSNLIKSVELKTTKKIVNKRQELSFRRFKTLKWYNQSYLINIKKIAVGFWNDDLIVDEIKEFTLKDLIELGSWNPDLCVYQLENILSFIKYCFTQHNTNLLKFTYDSFSNRLICDDKDVKKVLPDFYKNEFID